MFYNDVFFQASKHSSLINADQKCCVVVTKQTENFFLHIVRTTSKRLILCKRTCFIKVWSKAKGSTGKLKEGRGGNVMKSPTCSWWDERANPKADWLTKKPQYRNQFEFRDVHGVPSAPYLSRISLYSHAKRITPFLTRSPLPSRVAAL